MGILESPVEKAVRGGDPPPSYINRVASKPEPLSKAAVSYKVLWPGYYMGKKKDPRIGGVASFRKVLSERNSGYPFLDDDDDDDADDADDDVDNGFADDYVVHHSRFDTVEEAKAHGFDLTHHDPNFSRDYRRYWTKLLKEDEVNEEKNLKNRDCRSAEQAMAFYNDKHGTDYEIVETLGSFWGISCGFWIHCNFKAQRKSVTDTDAQQHSKSDTDTDDEQHSDDDEQLSSSLPKLFFAESYSDGDKWHVNFCDIVDDRKHRLRCSICAPLLRHPREFKAFVKGKPKRKQKVRKDKVL